MFELHGGELQVLQLLVIVALGRRDRCGHAFARAATRLLLRFLDLSRAERL